MLTELIAQHRAAILERWFERILEGYPQETARFLRRRRDPFDNPVGAGLREELTVLLDGVVGLIDDEVLQPALDRIIRVRAVQDMLPAQAVGFILDLKPIAAQVFGTKWTTDDRDLFARGVDELLLRAFNVYTDCREQMHDIRVAAIRNQSIKVVERLNAWREKRYDAGGLEVEESADAAADGDLASS